MSIGIWEQVRGVMWIRHTLVYVPPATSQFTQSAPTQLLAIPPLTARCHQHSPTAWRGHSLGERDC